jgi:hypothetical protein
MGYIKILKYLLICEINYNIYIYMEISYLLIILLIGLIIYYINESSKSKITEGFKKKKKRKISIFGKKKKKKSKSKSKAKAKPKKGLSLDEYNTAIIQVISKASDQSSVQATTETYTSGTKGYFEEAFKTNLKLTDAGAALSEEDFEVKAGEGIAAITNGGINEFTKWFNTFTTPEEVSSEESTEASE